jgi:hypothetical protein
MRSTTTLAMLALVLQLGDPASLPCRDAVVMCAPSLRAVGSGLAGEPAVAGALTLRGGCQGSLLARSAPARPEGRAELCEGRREVGGQLDDGEWAGSEGVASGTDSAEHDSGSGSRCMEAECQDACVVCCESTEHWAIGACGHRVACAACSLRMRVLLNSKECVTCKREQPFTIVSSAKEAWAELAKRTSTMLLDTSANVFYDDPLAHARMDALQGFHCAKWYA